MTSYHPNIGVHYAAISTPTPDRTAICWKHRILGDIGHRGSLNTSTLKQYRTTRNGYEIIYEGYPGQMHKIDVFGHTISAEKGGDRYGGFTSRKSESDVLAQFDAWATGGHYERTATQRIKRGRPKLQMSEVALKLEAMELMHEEPITRAQLSITKQGYKGISVGYKRQANGKRHIVHAGYAEVSEQIEYIVSWFLPMVNAEITKRMRIKGAA